MPVLEGLQVSAESRALSQAAHLQRTQDRILAWERKLAHPETTQAERDVIAEEMYWLKRQLTEPGTRHTLQRTPPPPVATPEAPNPLMGLVLSLKAQVDAMTQQLKGPHGAVSEPEAAAQG